MPQKVHRFRCYSFDIYEQILIIFGKNINEEARSQNTLYFPIQLTITSAIHCKTYNSRNVWQSLASSPLGAAVLLPPSN